MSEAEVVGHTLVVGHIALGYWMSSTAGYVVAGIHCSRSWQCWMFLFQILVLTVVMSGRQCYDGNFEFHIGLQQVVI